MLFEINGWSHCSTKILFVSKDKCFLKNLLLCSEGIVPRGTDQCLEYGKFNPSDDLNVFDLTYIMVVDPYCRQLSTILVY